MFSKLLSTLTVGTCLYFTGGADVADAANRVCGERDKLTKFLAKKYKENPKAVGVSTTGKAVMEIFTSAEGSWTVMMTTTTGVTCIMGAGHSWEEADQVKFLPKS